jgi:hypothetical protein
MEYLLIGLVVFMFTVITIQAASIWNEIDYIAILAKKLF